jgi:hypothetical protein
VQPARGMTRGADRVRGGRIRQRAELVEVATAAERRALSTEARDRARRARRARRVLRAPDANSGPDAPRARSRTRGRPGGSRTPAIRRRDLRIPTGPTTGGAPGRALAMQGAARTRHRRPSRVHRASRPRCRSRRRAPLRREPADLRPGRPSDTATRRAPRARPQARARRARRYPHPYPPRRSDRQ